MRTRLVSSLTGLLLLVGGLGGVANADPIAVRALAEKVRPAESPDGVPQADESVAAQLVALGSGAARDVSMLLVDVRQSVRLTAIEALSRLGADVATDPLVATLEHTDLVTVEAAALAIGRIGSPGSAGVLRAIIVRTSPEPAPARLRRAAVRALPMTGDERAAELLRPLLASWTDPEATAALVEALGRAGDGASTPAVAALLDDPARRAATLGSLWAWGDEGVRILREDVRRRDRDSAARAEVAEAALRFGASGMPLIESLLSQGDLDMRLALLKGLARFEDRAAVASVLRQQLRDSDAEILVAALGPIARDGDREATDDLLRLLEHRDARVRQLAARALGATTPASATNPLMFALSREVRAATAGNLGVRRAILWALGQYRTEAVVPALVEGLTLPDQRQAALDAIVETGKAAVGTLMLIVKSGDRRREREALEAILRIGEAKGRDIEALLRHPEQHARTLGLELTAAVGDDSAVPGLSRMVLDPEQPNRLEALRVLTLFYTPRLRPVFQEVVASGRDTRLRKAAIEAFWRNHDLDAVDYLVGVAEDDEDEEVRVAALRGLFFLDAPIAGKLFLRMLDYEKPGAQAAAADALGLMGEPRQLPALLSALSGVRRSARPHVARAIRRLARHQGDPEDTPDFRRWHDEHAKSLPRHPSVEEGDPDPPAGVLTLRDGRSLVYWDEGRSDATPIVAIHDGPDGAPTLLREGLSELRGKYRVVTYAQLDDGEQSWADFSVGREALDVGELCAALEIGSSFVLGHGFGALVAIRYAGMFPRATRRIVLVNAPYPVARSLEGFEDALTGRVRGDAGEALRWLDGRAGGSPRAVYERRRAWYAFPGLFQRPALAARHVPEVYDPVRRETLRASLGDFSFEEDFVELRRPVLIVQGDDDLYEESVQSGWARLLELKPGPDRIEIVKDSGHHVLLEKKKEATKLVRAFIED